MSKTKGEICIRVNRENDKGAHHRQDSVLIYPRRHDCERIQRLAPLKKGRDRIALRAEQGNCVIGRKKQSEGGKPNRALSEEREGGDERWD